jgi:hypothetical protein
MNPQDLIGEAGVKALESDGWELVRKDTPPEPRLVTMEETKSRYEIFAASHNGGTRRQWEEWFRSSGPTSLNAADDWLVKTVNRRIIEGMKASAAVGPVRINEWEWLAHKPSLLRVFTGRE